MTAQYCDISFFEKLRLYSDDYLQCCRFLAICESPDLMFTKKLYSKLVASSHLVEDFLDFHGAKNNKNWYLFREMSAAVRHLSMAGYIQEHISNRLVFYDLSNKAAFEKKGEDTRHFLAHTLISLAPAILSEAGRLGIPMPAASFSSEDFPSAVTTEMLEFDVDDERPRQQQQKKNIVKVTSDFLNIAKEFEEYGIYEKCDPEEVHALVPEKINEVVIRRFEMLVHNLQSSFDTYIIYGGLRYGDRRLKELRSYFSVVYHLFDLIGKLLHFYERHFFVPREGEKSVYKYVQNILTSLIDVDALLDKIVNYGLFYVFQFLSDGKRLALVILNENIERGRIEVGIPTSIRPRSIFSFRMTRARRLPSERN